MSEDMEELMKQAAEEGAEIGDDTVEIDLSEAVSFDPFTATVPVEIVKATMKVGKDSGKPYIELQLRVFEGEFVKRALFTNVNLTGKGAGIGLDTLEAFGYSIDRQKPQVSAKALVGLKANAKCAPDTREEYKHKVVVGKITRYVSEAEKEDANLK